MATVDDWLSKIDAAEHEAAIDADEAIWLAENVEAQAKHAAHLRSYFSEDDDAYARIAT